MIYINKVDRRGVDLEALYEEINTHLSKKTLVLESVFGVGTRQLEMTSILDAHKPKTDFYEKLALLSDDFMVQYFDDQVSESLVSTTLKSLLMTQKCFPVLHGAALLGFGISSILDKLTDWVQPRATDDFSAKVFKVDRCHKGIRKCYIRILRLNKTQRHLSKKWS